MGDKMFSVARKLSNKGFYGRLNVISAANHTPANDAMCHNTCWVIFSIEKMIKEKMIKRELKFYGN